MRCCNCKSQTLFGDVSPHVRIMLPLAKKGGNIITAGYVVKQSMIEEWWLKEGEADKLILGPIFCADCAQEHSYFKGLIPALRPIPYAEALQYGYDHYAASPKQEGEEYEGED